MDWIGHCPPPPTNLYIEDPQRVCTQRWGLYKGEQWKWKSLSHVRLFATPWTIVYRILQARILEQVAIPFSSSIKLIEVKCSHKEELAPHEKWSENSLSLALALPMCTHRENATWRCEKAVVCKPRRQPSPETGPCWALIWDFQPSKAWW